MKEVRFFYVPNAGSEHELPEEEAQHAVRVLRMQMGDEMMLMDGEGTFYKAEVAESTKKRCLYNIKDVLPQPRQWQPHLHLAMAPTKNMDRTEWLAEKATEIGFDELSFLRCKFSERTVVKSERVDKILVSAMKQSHKAWKPILNEMCDFRDFLRQQSDKPGDKFICHCYDEIPRQDFFDIINNEDTAENITVIVGPEGDFSREEVALAVEKGFVPVHLGPSRLRTETAAVTAVEAVYLKAFC